MQIDFNSCDKIINDILAIDATSIPENQISNVSNLKTLISEPENFNLSDSRFIMVCQNVSVYCNWLPRDIREAVISYLARDYDIWLIDKDGM